MKTKATKIKPNGGIKPRAISPKFQMSKIAPSNKIRKVCTSADENTWENIRNLSIKLEKNKLELLSGLIEDTHASPAYRKELAKFYEDFWLRRASAFSGRVTQNRINLPEQDLEMIRQMSWSIMGTNNRSELIRLLVAFWAWKNELLTFTK
jgi:hypothetical protein